MLFIAGEKFVTFYYYYFRHVTGECSFCKCAPCHVFFIVIFTKVKSLPKHHAMKGEQMRFDTRLNLDGAEQSASYANC
jgi:hypothetical protein